MQKTHKLRFTSNIWCPKSLFWPGFESCSRAFGRRYLPGGGVGRNSISQNVHVLTTAPTEIPILQSPGRQIDDFREGGFLQKGSWRAGPPDPEAKTTRFGSRMAATSRRSIIMTEYDIARDARQYFVMYVMLNSYIPKRDRNHACKKFFFQRSSYYS